MFSSKNTTPDLRIYATVFYSDHSLQYFSTVTICILATPLSFLMLYLIYYIPSHETFSIKFWSGLYHISQLCAQYQLGVIGGIVTLYPFPASYCVGLLSDYFDAFTLFFVYALLFCTYVYCLFIIQIMRLKAMARPGKLFDWPDLVYYIISATLALVFYIPVFYIMYICYSTPKENEAFVRRKFPNNLKVLEYPGVYLFTDSIDTNLMYTVMMVTCTFAILFMVFLYIAISYESKGNATKISVVNMKTRMKSRRNILLQAAFLCSFHLLPVFITFKTFFNDPFYDSRIENTVAYTCLCGTSIPSQILMILRKPEYVDFVLRRKRVVIINVGIFDRQRSTTPNN